MADASKLKDLKEMKSSLGRAPQLHEASQNIYEPELAPSSARPQRIDGRSLRRTHRTVRLSTSVTPEFDQALRLLALERRMLLSEVLEEAVRVYQSHKG